MGPRVSARKQHGENKTTGVLTLKVSIWGRVQVTAEDKSFTHGTNIVPVDLTSAGQFWCSQWSVSEEDTDLPDPPTCGIDSRAWGRKQGSTDRFVNSRFLFTLLCPAKFVLVFVHGSAQQIMCNILPWNSSPCPWVLLLQTHKSECCSTFLPKSRSNGSSMASRS